MVIAADIGLNKPVDTFFTECLLRMAAECLQHRFFVLSDTRYVAGSLPQNCTQIIPIPLFTKDAFRRYLYYKRLPGSLRPHKIDVIISEKHFSGFSKNVSRLLLIDSSLFGSKAEPLFYQTKKFMEQVQKIKTALVVDELLYKNMCKGLPSAKNLVYLPQAADNNYRPYLQEEKQMVRYDETAGNDYFVCYVSRYHEEKMIKVLKAFSIFKKWQKSSLKLMIIFSDGEHAITGFSNYKYKEEVRIVTAKKDASVAPLLASAYAGIALIAGNDAEHVAIRFFKVGVPLIIIHQQGIEEIYGNETICSDPDESVLSKHLIELYRNENYKNELALKGLERSQFYTWENSMRVLWNALQR